MTDDWTDLVVLYLGCTRCFSSRTQTDYPDVVGGPVIRMYCLLLNIIKPSNVIESASIFDCCLSAINSSLHFLEILFLKNATNTKFMDIAFVEGLPRVILVFVVQVR